MAVSNETEVWAKLSAGLWLNRKWKALCRLDSKAACLWISSISFSSMMMLDGDISSDVITELSGTPDMVHHIIQCGLGESDGQGGFFIHDYSIYQRTRKQIEQIKKARSKAGKKGMEARWHSNNKTKNKGSENVEMTRVNNKSYNKSITDTDTDTDTDNYSPNDLRKSEA